MKYLVIAALNFVILSSIAAPVEINSIVAVVNGNVITVSDVQRHALPLVRRILANQPNGPDKS